MKEATASRFAGNLARVKSLIGQYESGLPGVSGRPSVAQTDILRASVVFLHATLEDLLRSVLAWKLPTADSEHLAEIPLPGEKLRRYTLADVAQHRGTSVDDLITSAVRAWLDHSNFNDTTVVATTLSRAGVPEAEKTKLLDRHGASLEAMMKRRHWIVHRADVNEASGSGHFAALSLHPGSVRAWVSSVEAFGRAVLDLL